jgi:uncharacterized membrane protein
MRAGGQPPDGADEALAKLEKLNRDYLINLHDAAVVSWKVADEFRGTQAELIRTNLSDEQEAKLREAFGLED